MLGRGIPLPLLTLWAIFSCVNITLGMGFAGGIGDLDFAFWEEGLIPGLLAGIYGAVILSPFVLLIIRLVDGCRNSDQR